jgi:predicted ATPase
VPEITLTNLSVAAPSFRKLKNFKIDFAKRITLIAGHNGIGKSTILALIANGSGLRAATFSSYLGRSFQGSLNEVIHLDYATEFEQKQNDGSLPNPSLEYCIDGQKFTKRCSLTKRTINDKDGNFIRMEVRVVPRDKFISADGFKIGEASKVPIPTIYLGMTRMLPIGESNPELIVNKLDTDIDISDAEFISNFIRKIINFGVIPGQAPSITTQAISGTNKTTKHPEYNHSPKSISLGQDSLSAIATALASFRKLEREWAEYPGGLLVIDELDAGFHPHAQRKLIEGIQGAAKKLRIQVVATTHSLCLIEAVHPESNPIGEKGIYTDSVIYITDSAQPRVTDDFSLEDIRNDMALKAPEPAKVPRAKPKYLKCYLEDAEADFFLKSLLTTKFKKKVKALTGATLKPIPISVGCDNLQGLQKFDPHFKTVLIVVDADATVKLGPKNVVKLPGGQIKNGKSFSPERTIYEFIKELVQPNANYTATRAALRAMKVTSDQLSEHLIRSDLKITDREASKRWWKSSNKFIEDWQLVPLWLAEHPALVETFNKEFLAAAVATAKLQA